MTGRKFFNSLVVIIFFLLTCTLNGCGYKHNSTERDGIILAERKEDIFPGLFDLEFLLKKPKISFTDKEMMFFYFLSKWSSVESLSGILEKTFDVAEKLRQKKDIDLKRYYFLVRNASFIKAGFYDIKRKFEALETEFDVVASYRSNASVDLIGSVAYLKQTGPAIFWPNKHGLQEPKPFTAEKQYEYPGKHDRYRSAYDFKNAFIPPNSFGWPFNEGKQYR